MNTQTGQTLYIRLLTRKGKIKSRNVLHRPELGTCNYRGFCCIMDLVLIPGVCSLKSCKHLHKQLHGGSSVSQMQEKTLELCNIMAIEWYKEEDTQVYNVTCQAHPVLVKSGSNVLNSFLPPSDWIRGIGSSSKSNMPVKGIRQEDKLQPFHFNHHSCRIHPTVKGDVVSVRLHVIKPPLD